MPEARLLPGDPAPWFRAKCSTNPQFNLDAIAGRWLALTFVDSAVADHQARTIAEINARSSIFDDRNAAWFIVTADPMDEMPDRLPLRAPGIRAFFDSERGIRKLYHIDAWGSVPVTVILSPRLSVVGTVTGGPPEEHAEALSRAIAAQPPIEDLARSLGPPPITIIPNVLERDLCRKLIERYEEGGGQPSGFMREKDGRTVGVFDPRHKVRRDWLIPDQETQMAIQARFLRRVVPELRKVYNFHTTHMERYIVSCYDASEGGHFNAHRDNTTKGTAHRRFACSVNLNADEFEGGDLRFPEYGQQTYRPPTGGCVIFGCSLLHQATVVTKGKRYAFLPFLYDAEAAKIRAENAKHVDFGVAAPQPRPEQGLA